MRSLMSILTLYNFDETVFDNLLIPEGLFKEDVINNLVMELAELEIIYSSPVMMKSAIGFWSKKELPIWTKLLETTMIDYNPIWNQFRTEELTDTQTRNLTGSNNETRNLSGSNNQTRNLQGSDNETRDLIKTDNEDRDLEGTNRETRDLNGRSVKESETTGTTENTGTDTTKEYTYGFNNTTKAAAKETENILGSGNTVTGEVNTTDTTIDEGTVDTETTDRGTINKHGTDEGTINRNLSDTGTVNTSLTDNGTINKSMTDLGTIVNSHSATYEGHTGLVTVQKLLEQQREVVQFNVIDYIINSFKNRFCIQIY